MSNIIVTMADIIDMAPELEGPSNNVFNMHIGAAKQLVGTAFGEKRKYAVILMTAHLMTLARRGDKSGAISAETVGGITRSYGTRLGNNTADGTSYGRMFIQIRDSLNLTAVLI